MNALKVLEICTTNAILMGKLCASSGLNAYITQMQRINRCWYTFLHFLSLTPRPGCNTICVAHWKMLSTPRGCRRFTQAVADNNLIVQNECTRVVVRLKLHGPETWMNARRSRLKQLWMHEHLNIGNFKCIQVGLNIETSSNETWELWDQQNCGA